MDPVSVLAITNASLGIARSLVHTIQELYELAEAYETAALGIRTVATQCDSFRIAINRINKWLVNQNESSKDNLDEDFWNALSRNLETGRLVIDDLNARIQGLKKNPAKFWTRTKYLWNHAIISELQSQIQGLMSAVSLLIGVIDLPTTGAKRSLSRAQSTKLNGLTKSVRHRVDEQHRRIREDPEQNSVDDVDTSPLNNQNLPQSPPNPQIPRKPVNANIQRPLTEDAATDDAPPPPYSFTAEANAKFTGSAKKSSFSSPPVSPPENDSKESSFEVIDKSRAKQISGDKSKRTSWRSMMKIGKKSNEPRSLSDRTSGSDSQTSSSTTKPVTFLSSTDEKNQLQSTPAPIELPQDNYFELQSAISGMSVGQNSLYTNDSPSEKPSMRTTSQDIPVLDVKPPEPEAKQEELPLNNNPYLAMRLAPRSKSENSFRAKPDYSGQQASQTSNFDRIRPSQRVRDSRDRSVSQEPANRAAISETEPLERQTSGPTRLSSLSFFSSDELQQSWQTKATTNQTAKIAVKFDKESFTNRMSASAARALGVDDHIMVVDGVALASVTLLHTISDGPSDNDKAVVGDEIEFEVMTEHEVRTPQLNFGAGCTHYARIMEAGEYIYWDPRSIPESLRTVERLRMYRRFELVRW